ncbi:MAG: peptidase domain-containing ABC transporter [Pseudomonadota bacterium]
MSGILSGLSFGFGRSLPIILQTETAECGLASLAMVLCYHGVNTDLATLRSRHAVSLKGMPLATLVKLAGNERLGTRPVRLEMSDLTQLRLPAILHWELNHFVVLKEVGSDHVVIHDPASGVRRLSLNEMSGSFTGVALELWPDPSFQPREEKQAVRIKEMIGQITGLWPTLFKAMGLSLALEIFLLASPLFMQLVLDQVVVAKDSDLLMTLAVGFLLLLLFQQLISLARAWFLMVANTEVRVQWRSNVFAHLIRLPLDYFQKRHIGDVVSRVGSVDVMQQVLSSALIEAVFDGIFAIVTLLMMFLYSPALAGLAVLGVVIYVSIRVLWIPPFYRASEEQIVKGAKLSSHFLETVRGVRAVKLFGRQTERMGAWQALLVGEVNASLSLQKLQILYRALSGTLGGVFTIVLLAYGTSQVLAGALSVGMLIAFLAYRNQFEGRMIALVDHLIDLRMLRLQAERLSDVVLTPAESGPALARYQADNIGTGDIEFKNVNFRYAPDEPLVLDGLDLTVPAGQAIAIVGPSGCGKTTTVNLLLGILKPTHGDLLIGGKSLDVFGLDNWRGQVGTVMQDDTLFAGSVAENICFFDAQPDRERMQECAELVAVHEDILKMPMGYETLVGDMGTVLSGGQKQRVLLARALYKDPAVLILDEATSHLDISLERKVNTSIAELNITRVIIAHRLETIASAQRVVELRDGQVSFDGSPADYLSRRQSLNEPAGD